MRTTRFLLAGIPLLVAGCVLMRQNSEPPDPQVRLQHGVTALQQGDIDFAQEQFARVYTQHPGTPEAQQARLLLIATEADPDNPARRLYRSVEWAEELRSDPDAPAWMKLVGGVFERSARELRDIQDLLADTREPDSPSPEQQTLTTTIEKLTEDQDSLRRENLALKTQVAEIDRQLKAKTAELERILKVVRGGGGRGGGG